MSETTKGLERLAAQSERGQWPEKERLAAMSLTLAREVLARRKWETQARKALEAWAEWELTLEGVDYQITPPNGLADVKKLGRDALQDWADAQQGGAGGA